VSEPIEIAEARRLVLEAVTPLAAESVQLAYARGRVVAEAVTAAIDVPPFSSSAMDGFALAAGPARELRVEGEARAGAPAEAPVAEGTAARISTGAPMPEGADAVIQIERVELNGKTVRVPEVAQGRNVRYAGEDVRAGDPLLPFGTELGPAEVAVLASTGLASASCARRPRVAVLVTGDELAEPGEELGPGRIYSSNSFALAGQVELAGAELVSRDRVPDEREATRAALERALDEADVVCVSGGVSVGPHDHVKPALRSLRVEERFWGVRLKPGKPTWFGVRRGTLVFGLPGNPVSAMVTFQLFARPALRALMGAEPSAPRSTAVLDEPVERVRERLHAVRCGLRAADDGWHARPTGEQGSHQLGSMVGAHALALVPEGSGQVAAGERLEIELLSAAPAMFAA
jgi:molybdopterin molybdotransferase